MRRFINGVTIVVLAFSGIVPFWGGLLGLILLWLNPSWGRREKLIGSLIPVASALTNLLLFGEFGLGLVAGVVLTVMMVVVIATDAAWLSSRAVADVARG